MNSTSSYHLQSNPKFRILSSGSFVELQRVCIPMPCIPNIIICLYNFALRFSLSKPERISTLLMLRCDVVKRFP